jgi:AcrR family transcriptional regulator
MSSRGGQPIARTYSNDARRAEASKTRRRILDAARRLFAEHGYAATSVAGIARTANVSTQTVYNSVGSKRDLLTALLELTMRLGASPIRQRRIAESADPHEVIALTTRLRRRMMEGAGDIVRFTAAAAGADAEVRAAYVEGQARSRAGLGRVVSRLAALGALRRDLDVERATDAAYTALHHALWTRLVDECGWSADEAERWFTDVLMAVLLEDPRTG